MVLQVAVDFHQQHDIIPSSVRVAVQSVEAEVVHEITQPVAAPASRIDAELGKEGSTQGKGIDTSPWKGRLFSAAKHRA
jgi:hypothetical protein